MANRKLLYATPIQAVKHPFQLDVEGYPSLHGPYEVTPMGIIGSTIRLDMPGVPKNSLKTFRKPDNMAITFNATAPKKEGFPFDESERVYAGFVQVNENSLLVPVIDYAKNGCFLMIFPQNAVSLLFLPPSRSAPPQISSGSVNSDKGEGSSSGKSIVEAECILDQINLDAISLEGSGNSGSMKISSHESTKGSAKTKQGGGSSSGKSIHTAEGSGKSESVKILSQVSAQGSEKSEHYGGSSEKSIDKTEAAVKPASGETSPNESAEGSEKFEQGEGSSAKPIHKAEGSGKARSSKRSSNDDDEAWMLAWIKGNVFRLAVPEPPKESARAETSPTEQSTHEAPEIAIGSIEECSIHSPQCQCQYCDSNSVCLKTWSTTEDIIGYINRLKIKGPEGVCEKRVIQEDGQYSLYVRADLPGLEPHLRVTAVRDRCILVYGKPQSKRNYRKGGRSYLFFVKLRCSCCKFDNLWQNHEDGVLRLFCKIIGPERGHSAN